MAMSCRYAAQRCAHQLQAAGSIRASAQVTRVALASRRFNSTDTASANPKVIEIIDRISQLTLLETADLVSGLKVSQSARRPLSLYIAATASDG